MPVSPRTSCAPAGGAATNDAVTANAPIATDCEMRAITIRSPSASAWYAARARAGDVGDDSRCSAATTTRGTDSRSASMRSIRKNARSALPSSSRIAPRSSQGSVGAELQAALARRQQELRRWLSRSGGGAALPLPGTMVRSAVASLLERRVDQLLTRRRERLALDAPRDLEQRLAKTGGEILFLDQAGEQVGLAVRHVRLEHRRGVPADVAAEDIERRLMVLRRSIGADLSLRAIARNRLAAST